MIVEISKGDIKTTIDEALYEQTYKKKGWKIDKYETAQEDEIVMSSEDFVVKTAKEEVVNNYNASKKSKQKKFDDNIIKEN